MRVLPSTVASRCGVVTLAELLDGGWTVEAVRHAVRVGRLERVAPGRFAPTPSDDLDRFRQADLRLLRQSVAATLPGDRVAVSHLGAALHRRWPVWSEKPRACVTTSDAKVRLVSGLHLHRVDDHGAFVRREGVPVTSPTRTIVDIAREFGTEAALVPGDVALQGGEITLEALAAEVDRGRGLPGIDAARRVGSLLDALAESPLESRSRWHFDLHGIPPPTSQVLIYTIGGRFLGRVDHYWEEGVVGEADGALKYRDPDGPFALQKEKNRQQGFEDVDLEVARWGAKDLRDFTAAAARIERARERARRRSADGDRQWYAVPTQPPRVRISGVA